MGPGYFDSQRFLDEFNSKDDKALRVFHDAYWRRIFAFAYRFTQDREEARDQVQEAFLKLFKRDVHPWESLPNILTFLYTTTRNGCINSIKLKERAIRRAEVYSSLFVAPSSHPEEIENAIIEGKLMDAIAKALPSLPEENQLVWKLLIEERKSYREAADILKISEDGVKYRRSALFKKLRDRLSTKEFASIVAGFLTLLVNLYLVFKNKA
jgi:RNA polymerase sigma factor (sigma-70 family)